MTTPRLALNTLISKISGAPNTPTRLTTRHWLLSESSLALKVSFLPSSLPTPWLTFQKSRALCGRKISSLRISPAVVTRTWSRLPNIFLATSESVPPPIGLLLPRLSRFLFGTCRLDFEFTRRLFILQQLGQLIFSASVSHHRNKNRRQCASRDQEHEQHANCEFVFRRHALILAHHL